MNSSLKPLLVVAGPTASGKTSLAIHLAQRFHGEILSCDSVAVYRGMEIGTAKPDSAERALAAHHLLDVASPDQPCTAGDYSRLARAALSEVSARGNLPIVAGGTGLYLRALLEGLFPAPPQQPELRERLRQRAADLGEWGPAHLHRILSRIDPAAAALIHPNDLPKAIRAIEVSLAARTATGKGKPIPITQQWQQGRDALTGYRVLRLGLNPRRDALYARINQRAAGMFKRGLVEETRALLQQYGPECRALTSLGYAEAVAFLRNELSLDAAISRAQQGHRNYAKRQLTWFRREEQMQWLDGFGEDASVIERATELTRNFLRLDHPLPAEDPPSRDGSSGEPAKIEAIQG